MIVILLQRIEVIFLHTYSCIGKVSFYPGKNDILPEKILFVFSKTIRAKL